MDLIYKPKKYSPKKVKMRKGNPVFPQYKPKKVTFGKCCKKK